MAFLQPVQTFEDGSTSGNGTTFSFGSHGWEIPEAGNLIFVATAFRVGNRTFNLPSGYNVFGQNTGGGGPGRPVVLCYGRVSDGTESSVVCSWAGAADEWVAKIWEVDIQSFDLNASDTSDGQNSANSTTQGSGTTSSVDGEAAAFFASYEQNGETPSFSNGYVFAGQVLSGGPTNLVMDYAYSDANWDVAGTYSTTATWTSASNRAGIGAATALSSENGERLRNSKRTNTYRVTNFKGVPLRIETPSNDNLELVGLSWGQARKYRQSVTTPALIKRENQGVP